MSDFSDAKAELKRYFPAPSFNTQDGTNMAVLLDTFGEQLNMSANDVKNAKLQFQLASSVSIFLEIWGVNLDVFKPRGSRMTDPIYRKLIKIVANSKKNVELCFERLLLVFFGNRVFERGYADVYMVRPHEVVVRISRTAMIIASSRDLYGTTYIHRTNTEPYTGGSWTPWTSTILSAIPKNSSTMTMASVPAGCPLSGIMEVGDPSDEEYEIKGYTRVGAVVTFQSPTFFAFGAGKPLTGPLHPDDYPSGYLYDVKKEATTLGSFAPGVTSIPLGFIGEFFPNEGVAIIGDTSTSEYDVKAYVMSGTTMILEGPTQYPHNSGEAVFVPILNRKIKTTLTAPIVAGNSYATIPIFNGADFSPVNCGAKINLSRDNEEIIPCRGRSIGDNSIMNIDPDYVFKKDHAAGEPIQLMSLKSTVTITGEDWPFYLVDSDRLRDQFLSVLNRVKVTGFKLKIDFV
jgi:hypothetical protein